MEDTRSDGESVTMMIVYCPNDNSWCVLDMTH